MAGYPGSDGQVQILRQTSALTSRIGGRPSLHYGPSNSLSRANRKSCRSSSLCSLAQDPPEPPLKSKLRCETPLLQELLPPPRSSSVSARRPVPRGRNREGVNDAPSLSPRMPQESRNSSAAAQRIKAATPRAQSQRRAASLRGLREAETRPVNVQRFADAQRDTFDRALQEICQGRKSSCWMWFTIPTPPHIVNGVERGSSVNRKFALRSDEEARAFLKFETDDGVNLRENYMAIMTAVLEQLQAGRSPTSLLGHFDAPKLASSVQLFERITSDGCDPDLHQVLQEIRPFLSKKSSD